ncbi:MAG TPA: hypothetical protein VGC87_25880 [Pyrinomonadaceae bacterium]|jgi:hypothetical protein
MVYRLVLVVALIPAFCLVGSAQSNTTQGARVVGPARAHASSQTWTVEQLADAVGSAFMAGDLGRLDAERLYLPALRIRVEHSITGDIESRSFKTFKAAERWLKGRERTDGPARNVGALRRCRRGVCTFEREGMLHNNLYLQRVTYGVRRGSPYVKAIHIIDGD